MVKRDNLTISRIGGYLASINMMSDIQRKRVFEIFSQSGIICPEEIKDIFISNFEGSDGKDQFKDMWLFSNNFVIEVLNFSEIENVKMDLTIFNKNILDVTFETTNFDLSQKAKNNSKLHMEFFTGLFSCDQIAFGSNCDDLMKIFEKYVKNNLIRGRSLDSEDLE